MHSVESTIQRLISSGLDPKLENNPYLCFIYTSFQVSHSLIIVPARIMLCAFPQANDRHCLICISLLPAQVPASHTGALQAAAYARATSQMLRA